MIAAVQGRHISQIHPFSEGSKKRVEVPHLVGKVGAGFQQGFTISCTKGS